MWSLYKRGSVYWGKGPGGVRRSTGCRSKEAAERTLKRWEREDADPYRAAKEKATLDGALSYLVEYLSGLVSTGKRAQSTVAFHTAKAGHLLRLFGRECKLKDLSARDVDRYIEERRAEGVKEHTISKELVTLRLALRLAKRWGEWGGDIDAVLPVRFAPEYKPRRRFLSPAELRALLPHLWLDHAARVAFIVATSACLGETDRARREDVNLSAATVHIRGTKRASRLRTVPLVTSWQRSLARYALQYAQGKDGFLFCLRITYRNVLNLLVRRFRSPPARPTICAAPARPGSGQKEPPRIWWPLCSDTPTPGWSSGSTEH